MLSVKVTPHGYKMYSSVAQLTLSLSDPLAKCSQAVMRGRGSENRLDIVNEFRSCSSPMLEASNSSEDAANFSPCSKSDSSYPYKFKLEQDVERLQKQLQEEMELRAVLENAVEHTAASLSSPSCIPQYAQELLSNIATLEDSVSKLEQEMVSLQFQLSQERNERRLAEYHLKHSPSQPLFHCSPESMKAQCSSSFSCNKHLTSERHVSSEELSCQDRGDQTSEASCRSFDMCLASVNAVDSGMLLQDNKTSTQMLHPEVVGKLTKDVPIKGLWNHPNHLSEEMVQCMKNIFISLADSSTVSSKPSTLEGQCSPLSPHGHFSNSSLWSFSERSTMSSFVQSPQVDLQSDGDVLATENVCDPYRVRGKLSWADIGNYGLAVEVSWMSVGKKQLEYAAGALRRFRSLVEQLAKVNPIHLSCDEKLAFWINLYNALIMHAYLAYGVPRSDLKLFSLMQKAAYTVGGHSFSAAAIEYIILKMKPPVHRPQTALLLALHKLKVSEEQRKFSIETFEPLVAFTLSCGMYSSPAVRIYTAKNVKEELKEAQRDFIRASVGVSSKGKLLVPKMLHCFARGFVDDSNLAVWICRYLPPNQAAFVEQCMSHRRQSFLGSRNCGILPFDSRFRYLFLPD